MSSKALKREIVLKNIGDYPDFPKKGILFRDIFGVLKNPEASEALQDLVNEHCDSLRGKIDAVCALESRGFLFGPQIAVRLSVPFIPIRKKGKLPGEVKAVSFQLEYGSDEFEMQSASIGKGDRVLLVDDLLATGGSLAAACKLVSSLGGSVEEALVIMELKELSGRTNIPITVHSILEM